MGNLTAAGYHAPDEIRLAADHILGIHVKDANPKVIRGVPYGEGIVPFKDVFSAMAESGFWGMLGVEMWADRHEGEDIIEVVANARKFVQDLVDAETWVVDTPMEIKTSQLV